MNAEALRSLAFRFREARALYAGLELGLFAALGHERRSAADLAGELRGDPRGLRILLDALCALGITRRVDDHYALDEGAADALLPDAPGSIANLLRHDLWHWPSWTWLDRAVHSGQPHADRAADRYLGSPDVLRHFFENYTRAMEQSSRGWTDALAASLARLEPARVADLGGGSGALLLALLERSKSTSGILVDHAFALERAALLARSSPAGERLTLCPLDIERDPLPSGCDCVLLSRVLMGLPAERARALIERSARALPAGGRLVICEFDADSRVGALLSLDMLLHTGAEVHRPERIESWLAGCGLELERHALSLPPYLAGWVGRRTAREGKEDAK